ncbi:DNA alkylation repair protein [Flavobacterium piscisymbiosum]|uniref:DNA alkylation repair protein n=1 Tax=Flavobacterium piscisymbiosum TaxID=2893753 RepID=A0ABS8MJ05_9FLAO|nr:DNA alkylation repair protein [Flavobacterium sp. F-30]MCC9064655.1 DNA alkylation repair protein [Flavobacterium sp. F-30]
MIETKRKGSRSAKDIPTSILNQLNKGEIETANLVEWLAVDQKLLLENVLKQLNLNQYIEPIINSINSLQKQTVNTINETIGNGLLEMVTQESDAKILDTIQSHQSDLVRCWATYIIGHNTNLTIAEKLTQIKPFAADKHFGVREISWLAIRPELIKNLDESLAILSKWTNHTDENVRRFASEATRPRGVWSEHIEKLKQNPELGLVILEHLYSDSSKYVQNSVANWLNDVSKTKPQFVLNICAKWQEKSASKETIYIIKKALRTIEK